MPVLNSINEEVYENFAMEGEPSVSLYKYISVSETMPACLSCVCKVRGEVCVWF